MRISVSVLQTNQSDPAISPLSNNNRNNKNQFKNETMAPSHGKQKLENSNSQQKFDNSQKLVDISKISEPGQSRKKQYIPDTITPGVHWRVVQKAKMHDCTRVSFKFRSVISLYL